jgi:glycosyltransferase involved in cell wall biosynthesis
MQLRARSIAEQLGATDFLGPQHVIPLNVRKRLNTGVIVHDLVFDRYPETMQLSNRVLSRRYAPKSIRAADHIFCVSETTLRDLETFLNREMPNAVVSHPGLTAQTVASETQAILKAARSSTRLLIVGSMEPRKNVAQFLRVFLELTMKHSNIHLDMVSGDGWGQVLGTALHERVAKHPMIKVHQGISDAALDALYREVDFLVFPSIYEGFGLPILEAVGKCSVIANDIPVFRELAAKIDGVELLDFSVHESTAAERLAALLGKSSSGLAQIRARFKDQFRWETCANTIVTRMGLVDKSVSKSCNQNQAC